MKDAHIEGGVVVSLQLALTRSAPSDRQEVMTSIVDMYISKIIDERAFYDILDRNSVGDSFARWELLQHSNIEANGLDREFRDKMIRGMIDSDASRAMNIISEGKRDSLMDLRSGMLEWLQNDPQSAVAWINEKKVSMTVEQQDALSAANFSNALEFSDLDAAGKWLDEISSSKIKSELQAELDSKK